MGRPGLPSVSIHTFRTRRHNMATPETELAKGVAERRPFYNYYLISDVMMAGGAVVGGYVNFRPKKKAGKVRGWNFTELIGEMFVSAFVGVLTYWICQGFEINQ